MKVVLVVCVSVLMNLSVVGFAEEAAASSNSDASISDILVRLDQIERRLSAVEKRFGKHLPGSESVSTIFNDMRNVKNDVRNLDREIDRVASDLRRVESQRR